MAQHGEIVGPAGAATTGGEKPEGKAPAGPGQLQEEAGAAKRTTLSSGGMDSARCRSAASCRRGRKTVVSMPLAMTVTGIPDRAEEAAARRAIQREQPTTVNRFHPS
jgi:hypothetical protein